MNDKALSVRRAAIKGFGAKRLALFGSFATEEASASSDVDFVVEFEKKTFDSYMGLKMFPKEILGRKVDLVLKDSIKPALRRSIMAEMADAPGF